MWLFTRYGFFSVVLARQVQDDQVTSKVNPDSVMIRARRRNHLEALLGRFPGLGNPEILETHNTDYRFRTVVPHVDFSEVAKSIAAEIDYTNFKSACGEAMPEETAYLDALHSVWDVHYGMQEFT
jgi:hypothetical protein